MTPFALPLPLRLGLLALFIIAPSPALAQTDAPREQANPILPRVELQAGIHLIRAEVAADFASRARGLMFRDSLGPNQGMLFVFEARSKQCFWMRNTRIPLSIAFLEDNGKIVNIADMQPHSDDSHCSARPVRYVLEMEQGWFARKGLKEGSPLAGPKGLFKTE
jgi:uncharacterized membrane protein (UPF0127 family)